MPDSRRSSRDKSHRPDHKSRNRDRSRDYNRSRVESRPRSRSRIRSRSRTELRPHDRQRLTSRSLHRERSTRQDSPLHDVLGQILSRLSVLEGSRPTDIQQSNTATTVVRSQLTPIVPNDSITLTTNLINTSNLTSIPNTSSNACHPESVMSDVPVITNNSCLSQCEPVVTDSALILAETIKSLGVLKNHNYFVSNFDPAINDIDAWCEEIEKARSINRWSDSECLSRVAGCLKGDARTWLNQWVTHDRTWSNFCKEFKSLCPRRLDYANILYEAMQVNSDKFSTYAEYARRTLLRLKIVKGLSDELRALIVIRGIADAQVKAAATNANIGCDDLV